MRMLHIEVIRAEKLQSGSVTKGILREKAFDSGSMLVSKSTVSGGTVSDWHHHGGRTLYGFVVSGRLRLECVKNGTDAVEVREGDFFHIPPGLVHRDVNPDRSVSAVIVNVLAGEGPAVVNVEAP